MGWEKRGESELKKKKKKKNFVPTWKEECHFE